MAKNVNASAIMKELLSNLFKYANPIRNTEFQSHSQQAMYVDMDTQQ